MLISSVKFNDMNTQLHKHTITLIHINSELINTQCKFKINLNSNSNQNSKYYLAPIPIQIQFIVTKFKYYIFCLSSYVKLYHLVL